MSDLNACPFCGRIPDIEDCGEHRWFIRCKCGVAQDKLFFQKCDAVRAWNKRKTLLDKDANVPINDTISRQAAIDECYPVTVDGEVYEVVQVETLMGLPSVQSEPMCVAKITLTDEQVKEAFEKAKCEILAMQSAQPEPKWIPFKTRPLTEEEKEEHPEWDCILDCKLPDDGQAILVSINVRGHERVQYDEFFTDDGSYLDSGYEIGTEATAWMPLPEPYKGEQE